ncbi:MAG: YdcF family protein [Sandaracinaceae bacterium]
MTRAGLLSAFGLAACGPFGPELLAPTPAPRPADAIVVLGNRPPLDGQGRVAPETARRVRRGVELFEAGLAPLLVVTGGPAGPGVVEADVMAEMAARLGVPQGAILRERASRSTAENARMSLALLCAGRESCRPEVVVVTSPYHLRRAARLFRCAGAAVQVAGTELPPSPAYQLRFTAYEYAAGIHGLLTDDCGRARRR